jgi:hypothetical protein
MVGSAAYELFDCWGNRAFGRVARWPLQYAAVDVGGGAQRLRLIYKIFRRVRQMWSLYDFDPAPPDRQRWTAVERVRAPRILIAAVGPRRDRRAQQLGALRAGVELAERRHTGHGENGSDDQRPVCRSNRI